VTQPVKSDAVTLIALGSRMGLQGFEATPVKAASKPEAQPTATPKPTATANCDRAEASTVMALAKSARLRCVADETGAL
jgi:hypothetical protein